MATTESDLLEGEETGKCFMLRNLKEKSGFEDMLLTDEGKKIVERMSFLFFPEDKREQRLWEVDIDVAI